ncbi:hypothetical protein [Pampinifervens florentissimum]|nr:hypothetical protein [Hydrogenobacter sp. T-8]
MRKAILKSLVFQWDSFQSLVCQRSDITENYRKTQEITPKS